MAVHTKYLVQIGKSPVHATMSLKKPVSQGMAATGWPALVACQLESAYRATWHSVQTGSAVVVILVLD